MFMFFSLSSFSNDPPIFLFDHLFDNLLFLIYSPLLHILVVHSFLTSLLSRHLSLFSFEEGGRKSLFSYDLHCSVHFLINATNKVVPHHLMMPRGQMQDIQCGGNRLHPTRNFPLDLWFPLGTPQCTFDLSLQLPEQPSFSGLWLVALSPHTATLKTSSLVLGHLQFFYQVWVVL